ncbi:MAG TPA: GTPase ObgE, partial [Chitinophagales bacterium]|nr:GTPase ObgE [Chitinophagales bacterium]
MDNQNFVDYVKILFRSGKGGAGSMHFHRSKLTAKGGPDGGDGGRGGHIILKGNSHMWTLLHMKYQKHVFAGDGQSGAAALKTGKQGEDRIIEV